jgi:hypothetical protein
MQTRCDMYEFAIEINISLKGQPRYWISADILYWDSCSIFATFNATKVELKFLVREYMTNINNSRSISSPSPCPVYPQHITDPIYALVQHQRSKNYGAQHDVATPMGSRHATSPGPALAQSPLAAAC